MMRILSGQFDDFERAEMVAGELQMLGVCSDDIQQFALDAPVASAGLRDADFLRPAGVRVAVHVPGPEQRAQVMGTFVRNRVRSIEEASGTWRNGAWVDFDPVSAPVWVISPRTGRDTRQRELAGAMESVRDDVRSRRCA
jgi:hypothetical protein